MGFELPLSPSGINLCRFIGIAQSGAVELSSGSVVVLGHDLAVGLTVCCEQMGCWGPPSSLSSLQRLVYGLLYQGAALYGDGRDTRSSLLVSHRFCLLLCRGSCQIRPWFNLRNREMTVFVVEDMMLDDCLALRMHDEAVQSPDLRIGL